MNAKTVDIGTVFEIPALTGRLFAAKDGGESVPQKIPGYIFRVDLLRKTLLWMSGKVGRSIYFAGPAGSGKTSLGEQVAARLGWESITLSCNARTERADIVGYMGLKNGGTSFIDGPLTTAVREGRMIIFDEGDALPPSVTIVLNRVLEGAPLYIPETGETIQPHPDFRIAFTGNTRGRGDDTGSFRARQVQDAAILDRFLFVDVDYPTPDEEKEILTKKFGESFPETIVDLLVRFGNETRAAHQAGELSAPLSTRGLVRIGEIIATGLFSQQPSDNVVKSDPLWAAIAFGFADGLGKEEAEGLKKVLDAVKAA
ncbi:AAA domain-containing protein [Acidithiobacillus thiooxidans]|uniref:ATP-binding protein n=1 Tax=Acidithiobacillus thiooxidans TaxID=930 RepID=UPI0002625326|nr:AAA family ATPase [Acidithiobacillus thiooxidans]MBU2792164.1 AAA domain-containing protein [Acidithiobacillus thiooxidans]MBU2811641.1 AAA domain-containing protein [Acidithiobacillus thiooxidans]